MEELRIRRITKGNWNEWADLILEAQHETFPQILWLQKQSLFKWISAQGGYVARLATCGKEFVGFIYGVNENVPQRAMRVPPGSCRVMHLCYLFIAPRYQFRGYGARMLEDAIICARESGYDKLSLFAKVGPSLHNVRKFGMTELEVKPDFMNTGHTYILCAMDL